MKNFIFVILFFFNFSNLNANIVYIDINLILSKSDVGKSLNIYLKKINEENLNMFSEIETQLVKKDKDLIAQKNIIKVEEYEKQFEKLSQEVQKYRQDKKTFQNNLNKIRINNTKKYYLF